MTSNENHLVSMTSAEAGALDPALRMMLEVVYECFEDAGIPMQSVVGSDTSVFVGTSSSGRSSGAIVRAGKLAEEVFQSTATFR